MSGHVPRKTSTGKVVHRQIADFHPNGHWYDRVNKWLAVRITRYVGTMWCAYAFAIFDCLALSTAIHQGLYGIVQWVASFFLQLVLLSIIMVGQLLQGTAADVRSEKTFEDTEGILDRLDVETQGGLQVVMAELQALRSEVAELRGGKHHRR